jgi:AraC-like DNA-binding protein
MIAAYWRLDSLREGQVYVSVPKRHIELVINDGAPHVACRDRFQDRHEFRSAWLTGLRHEPLFQMPQGTSVQYGVVFQDFALPDWVVTGVARNRGWSTDVGKSPVPRGLFEMLCGCQTVAAAAHKLDQFFLDHVSAAESGGQLITAVSECELSGRLTPANILSLVRAPPRRIRQLAQSISGTSLRRYVRLVRFDRALRLISEQPELRMADIAHEVGYYDEPHMDHDFAELCHSSPNLLRKSRLGLEGLPYHFYSQ